MTFLAFERPCVFESSFIGQEFNQNIYDSISAFQIKGFWQSHKEMQKIIFFTRKCSLERVFDCLICFLNKCYPRVSICNLFHFNREYIWKRNLRIESLDVPIGY